MEKKVAVAVAGITITTTEKVKVVAAGTIITTTITNAAAGINTNA